MRKFEKLSHLKCDIPLPKRSTAKSAGYDISIIHPSVYQLMEKDGCSMEKAWETVQEAYGNIYYVPKEKENFVFPTGVKASMEDNEVLMLFIRSSVGIKQHIKLSNQTGIIDADYYNNPDNEGHIMVALDIPKRIIPDREPSLFTEDEYNMARYLQFDGPTMRICQGIFLDYQTTDDDSVSEKRTGGIGSTGKA